MNIFFLIFKFKNAGSKNFLLLFLLDSLVRKNSENKILFSVEIAHPPLKQHKQLQQLKNNFTRLLHLDMVLISCQ